MSRQSKRIKEQSEFMEKPPNYAVDVVEAVKDDPDDFLPEPVILHDPESKYLFLLNRQLIT